jgi:hypothetical protein
MKAMHQGDVQLSGRVDVDESSVGGKGSGKRGRSEGKKRSLLSAFKCSRRKLCATLDERPFIKLATV